MKGVLPEMMMLHCLNTSGGVSISSGAELTVLERQRSRIKWQQQQGLVYSNVHSGSAQGDDQLQGQMCKDSGLCQVSIPMVKPELDFDIAWSGFGNYGMPSAKDFESCGYAVDSGIDSSYQIMKSCPVLSVVSESSEGKDSILTAIEGGKKRKAERAVKVASDVDTKDMKKIKAWAEDVESKVTQHSRSTNRKSKKKAGEASRDASKASEVQTTDYIHVRARPGQATDSHSLAERVRREKISERMRYLQELVPGCNKITGKAGMLDEIINYVQSLQKQVEFLSMKLATVNPQINISIDSPFGKEVFTPCTSSYPTLGELSEMANPAYLHFNPLEESIFSGMDTGSYQPQMGLQQQLLETYVDTSSLNQNSSTREAELHNLLAMEFHGGSIFFPSRPFTGRQGTITGSTEASNQRMEI